MLAPIIGTLASREVYPNLPTLEVFSMPATASYSAGMTYINGTFALMGYSVVGGFPAYSYWSNDNGATWTRVNQPAYEWRSTTLATNGSAAVMLSGNSGPGNRTIRTTDGQNWTQSTNLPASTFWYGNGAGNGIFIGGAFGQSTLITSPDGITWSSLSTNVAGVDAVAYLNGVWLVGFRNSAVMYRSTDPLVNPTWQAISKIGYSFNASYIMVEGGRFFVFISTFGNTTTMLSSLDGNTWDVLTIPFGGVGAITRCGNYWLATGSSPATGNVRAFLISKDLITWDTMAIPIGFRDSLGRAVYANGYYVGTSPATGYAYRLSGFIA